MGFHEYVGEWWGGEEEGRSQGLNVFKYLLLPRAVQKLAHWLLLPSPFSLGEEPEMWLE